MKKTLIAIAAMLALTTPSMSQTLIDGSDLETVVNAARGFGAASLQQDKETPTVRGRIDGRAYYIFFRNCEGDTKCDDFYFQTYFLKPVVDMDLANAWNRDKRWLKVYFDKDNDAVLEMDVDLTGGVSPVNLDQAFSYWSLGLEQFESYFEKQ